MRFPDVRDNGMYKTKYIVVKDFNNTDNTGQFPNFSGYRVVGIRGHYE